MQSDYYLQWRNPDNREYEGERIFPDGKNLASEYPGGYKYWIRRLWEKNEQINQSTPLDTHLEDG